MFAAQGGCWALSALLKFSEILNVPEMQSALFIPVSVKQEQRLDGEVLVCAC